MKKGTHHQRTHRKCPVTERKTAFGNTVAHCNKKQSRAFRVNMIKKKLWVASQNRFVTLRLSARGLKTLDKHGTEYLVEKGVI